MPLLTDAAGTSHRRATGSVRIVSLGAPFSLNNTRSLRADGGVATGDGTLNYDTGQVQNLLKFLTEVSLNYNNFGVFARGTGFVDTKADDTERTDLTGNAKDKVEKHAELLDIYAYANFDLGSMLAQLRVGKQVVNWGESTFYVSGLSSLNYFDVTKLRGAAVELRSHRFVQASMTEKTAAVRLR